MTISGLKVSAAAAALALALSSPAYAVRIGGGGGGGDVTSQLFGVEKSSVPAAPVQE